MTRLEVMSTLLCSTRLHRRNSSSSSTRRSTMGRPRRSTGTRRRRSTATSSRRPSRGSSPTTSKTPTSRGPPSRAPIATRCAQLMLTLARILAGLLQPLSLYFSGSLLQSDLQIAEPMHIPCRYTDDPGQHAELLLRDLGIRERHHLRWKAKQSSALRSLLC